MPDLTIDFDWIDPQGARGPELRATWARLTMRANGGSLIRVLDEKAQTVREDVYTPLYPLAEWIATHWWQLLYEVQRPHRSTLPGFEKRHNLATAREGFALPRLRIEPLGEAVRLTWEPYRVPYTPLEFVTSGTEYLDPASLRETLEQFVGTVVARLDALEVFGTPLQEEWSRIQDLEEVERAFCRAAGALGMDPFALDEGAAEAIIAAGETLPEELYEEFFSSVEVSEVAGQAQLVAEMVRLVSDMRLDVEQLRQLKRSFGGRASSDGSPWKEGYRVARDLRESLGLDSQPLSTMAGLGVGLGIGEATIAELTISPPGRLTQVDAILGYTSEGSPAFVLDHFHDTAHRFAFCRGLFEHLTVVGCRPALVTKGRTERQKRNRAFAAEFLVPASALRDRIDTELVSDSDIDPVAEEFGVSWWVVRHQLENHGIARFAAD